MANNLKDLFIEIINEHQLDAFAGYSPRELKVEFLPRKALVITGVRRAGKTTYLKQLFDQIKSKDSYCQQFYVNFSDDRISNIHVQDLNEMMDAIQEITLEQASERPLESMNLYLYLDEIQLVKDWEKFVDRLLRRSHTFVILSGSSADLLSQEIATQMRGRSLSYELTPYSFNEYLHRAQARTKRGSMTSTSRIQNKKYFLEYLMKGGFPEVFNLHDNLSIPILQEYVHSIFYRDIVERHKIQDTLKYNYLIKSLIQQSASLYTINRVTDKLKSIGFKIDKSAVSNFTQWIQDAYCLFSIPTYSESIQKQNVNPKKIYSIDNGLITALKVSHVDLGHYLENLVFQEIRRQVKDNIFYYKTENNLEVDFIIKNSQQSSQLIQVCYDMSNEEVIQREIKALLAAQKETGIKNCKLIVAQVNKKISVPAEVKIIEASHFFLNWD